MALRDQPYIPLYIQDIMTDEKLNECSAATHGIYIKGLMCLMHKSEEYGKILLKQKYKQSDKQGESNSLKFAKQLVKHLPYSIEEIKDAIDELIRERVCYFEGDYLCQKRMIRDNEISEARSKAGKKGGGNPSFVKTKLQTKAQTNSEYENEYENNIKCDIKEDKDKRVQGEKKKEKKTESPTWRTDYKIYLDQLKEEYTSLLHDQEWLQEKKKFNPGVNIQLSLEKACVEFWATEAGWKHKKQSRSQNLDWRSTLTNALSLKSNRVYETTGNGKTANNTRKELENLRDLSEAVLQGIAGGQHS